MKFQVLNSKYLVKSIFILAFLKRNIRTYISPHMGYIILCLNKIWWLIDDIKDPRWWWRVLQHRSLKRNVYFILCILITDSIKFLLIVKIEEKWRLINQIYYCCSVPVTFCVEHVSNWSSKTRWKRSKAW